MTDLVVFNSVPDRRLFLSSVQKECTLAFGELYGDLCVAAAERIKQLPVTLRLLAENIVDEECVSSLQRSLLSELESIALEITYQFWSWHRARGFKYTEFIELIKHDTVAGAAIEKTLQRRAQRFVSNTMVILHRIEADRQLLRNRRLAPIGPCNNIMMGQSDPHLGGQSVCLLSFGAQRVIYKPKSAFPGCAI